MVFLYQM